MAKMGQGAKNRVAKANSDLAPNRGRAREAVGAYKTGVPSRPYWETTALEDMSPEQWEALCDGCGRCCLNKLEDEDTGDILLTRLACGLLDISQCRCSDYANRFELMPDCINLTPEKVRSINWLPPTCGYRRVKEGLGLAWWHPLISGDRETVHQAGISVRGLARSEKGVAEHNFYRYIIADFGEE